MFNREHRAKAVNVHCVVNVIIISDDNNSMQSFKWPMLSLTITLSLICKNKQMGLCLQIVAMLNSLLRFSCFTIVFTCRRASVYSAIVSSLSFFFLIGLLSKACLTSLLIYDGILMVPRLLWFCFGLHH